MNTCIIDHSVSRIENTLADLRSSPAITLTLDLSLTGSLSMPASHKIKEKFPTERIVVAEVKDPPA